MSGSLTTQAPLNSNGTLQNPATVDLSGTGAGPFAHATVLIDSSGGFVDGAGEGGGSGGVDGEVVTDNVTGAGEYAAVDLSYGKDAIVFLYGSGTASGFVEYCLPEKDEYTWFRRQAMGIDLDAFEFDNARCTFTITAPKRSGMRARLNFTDVTGSIGVWVAP